MLIKVFSVNCEHAEQASSTGALEEERGGGGATGLLNGGGGGAIGLTKQAVEFPQVLASIFYCS